MTEIIGVRFKNGGKVYYFNPNGLKVEEGQYVIAETARGVEYGLCAQGNTSVDEHTIVSPLRPIIRIATEQDKRTVEQHHQKEQRAMEICQQKIEEHGLDMKLVSVEYNFEGNKLLFFFTSDGRVDFRELVRDLAAVFHTRIELRQIGVRDEAKMLGGLGVCGRPFCCAAFLNDFQPVSIKMAKTQNLSLNPTKISGACGRLMCCLKYEQDAYEDILKRCPKMESLVETPDGVGTVSQVNLLREQCKVRLDNAPDEPRCYHNCDICVIRSGKGKRPAGYELPEQPEKPAGPTRLRKTAPPLPGKEEPVLPPVTTFAQEGEEKRRPRRRKGGEKAKALPQEGHKAAPEAPPGKAPKNRPKPKEPSGRVEYDQNSERVHPRATHRRRRRKPDGEE